MSQLADINRNGPSETENSADWLSIEQRRLNN